MLTPKAAFDVLTAAEWNELVSLVQLPTVNAVDLTSRTTTSTSFTGVLSPAGLCGVAFVAPPSGVVLIHTTCELKNSAGNFTACAPAVRTGSVVGSGSAVLVPSVDFAVRVDQSDFVGAGRPTRLAGLVAGNPYNVSLEQQVGAGTGTYARREVIVEPQLG